jgi:chromosome partitioning protein
MLSSAELRLASMIGRERLLSRRLAKIKSDYDICIIDTSPTLGLLAVNALVAADDVLIPICPDYFSLKGIKLLEDTIDSVRQNLASRLTLLGVLVTRYRKRVITDSALAIIAEYFGPKLFKVKIPENIAVEEAHNAHMPLRKYDAGSKAAAAYRQLAKEAF